MSQYGPDSDRPRGRRHRPGSDWSDYDATSQGDREFPDLQPIRPREARARDARLPGGYGGGTVPGAFGGGAQAPQGFQEQPRGGFQEQPQGFQEQPRGFSDAPRGYQDPQGYQEPGPSQYGAPSRYGQYGQPDAAQPSPAQYGEPRSVGRHSAPQPALSQQPLPQPSAQQQPPMSQPPASQSRAGQAGRGRRPSAGDAWDDQDSEDPMAAFSERWRRRGQDTPEEGRKRTRLLIAGGGVLALAIACGVYYFTAGGGGANPNLGALVTTFLPGELQQVPNACTAVSSGTLSQDLPGHLKQASPPMNTGAQSQCSWTLDNPPTYRVLEVNLNAYSPSTLASGDGSATFAAIDAVQEAQNAKQKPGAKSGQPAATVSSLSTIGSGGFSAIQQFKENGATMDMATVEVRYHNVVVQVVLNGIDHSDSGKQYGPVSESTLQSQAQTIAQQVTRKVSG